MMDIKEVSLQWFINLGGTFKNEKNSNKELLEEFHKLFIRKFKNRKVQSREKYHQKVQSLIDNIWGADLADMQLISIFNTGICFLCYRHLQQICMGYSFKI